MLDNAKSENDASTIENNNDERLNKVNSEEGFFVDRKEQKINGKDGIEFMKVNGKRKMINQKNGKTKQNQNLLKT